jgi:hypothetical protein
MNKIIKEALSKGKVLREELDKKAAEEAKKRKEQQRAAEAKKEAELQADVAHYLSCVPKYLAKAVAERKPSFLLMSGFEADVRYNNEKFDALAKLIEPKLKKMGLQCKHTTSTGWVTLTCDPDTGYNARYLQLEVIVPEEGL